jgi:hypothetical protein
MWASKPSIDPGAPRRPFSVSLQRRIRSLFRNFDRRSGWSGVVIFGVRLRMHLFRTGLSQRSKSKLSGGHTSGIRPVGINGYVLWTSRSQLIERNGCSVRVLGRSNRYPCSGIFAETGNRLTYLDTFHRSPAPLRLCRQYGGGSVSRCSDATFTPPGPRLQGTRTRNCRMTKFPEFLCGFTYSLILSPKFQAPHQRCLNQAVRRNGMKRIIVAVLLHVSSNALRRATDPSSSYGSITLPSSMRVHR